MNPTLASRVENGFRKLEPWLGWTGGLLWAVSIIVLVINPTITNLAGLVVIAGAILLGATLGPLLIAIRYRNVLGTWLGVIIISGLVVLIQAWPRLQEIAAPALHLPAIDQVSAVFTLELWIVLGIALVVLLRRHDAGPLLLGGFSLVWIWGLALGIVRAGSAAKIVLAMLEPAGLWWYNALTTLACCLVPVGLGGTLYQFLRLIIREYRREW